MRSQSLAFRLDSNQTAMLDELHITKQDIESADIILFAPNRKDADRGAFAKADLRLYCSHGPKSGFFMTHST